MATISLGFSSSVFKNHQLQQQQAVFTKSPTLGPGHPNLSRTRISCAAAKREPRGITKPRPISIEMQELLGVAEIPRTQALKQIWAYIKQHNLQVSLFLFLKMFFFFFPTVIFLLSLRRRTGEMGCIFFWVFLFGGVSFVFPLRN